MASAHSKEDIWRYRNVGIHIREKTKDALSTKLVRVSS